MAIHLGVLAENKPLLEGSLEMKIEINIWELEAIIYCLKQTRDVEERDWAREQYESLIDKLESFK